MKYLLLAGLAFIVSSCAANNGPSFATMSELELLAYNRELPREKQVFCVEDADSSTFTRRRRCQSYEDWVRHNEKAAMTLDLLNSSPVYSFPTSIPFAPSGDRARR